MRMLKVLVRAAIPALAFTAAVVVAQTPPPGFPKTVSVPQLVMTGVGAPPATTTAPFQPKEVKVQALQMTGVAPAATKQVPFRPKKIQVPMLTMTGVN